MFEQPLLDAWGNPYIYEVPGPYNEPFDIVSCGRDGVPGSRDDVRYSEM